MKRQGRNMVMTMAVVLALAVAAGALAGALPARGQQPLRPAQPWPEIALVEEVSGLTRPTYVTQPDDGTERLFIVERDGTIRISEGGVLHPTPFLDISAKVSTSSEQGLLSMAFPPDFADHGIFFVDYTNLDGDTVIASYQVGTDADAADPDSERVILTVEQPAANHNGGQLQFGPDGYLYISLGDGGGSDDQFDNAQDPGTLLGAILRIDVPLIGSTLTFTPTEQLHFPLVATAADGEDVPYTIPATNPLVGVSGARGEIWAYGLRNPWRFSFDRDTGDMYIGDVGQGDREEIDVQPAASAGGENYGWPIWQGTLCYTPDSGSDCTEEDFVFPIVEYETNIDGCAVTGGYVYRGTEVPELEGIYLYGDYCSGTIWGAQQAGDTWESAVLETTSLSITSFGEDAEGNLYVVDWSGGTVYRVTAATP